MELHDCGMECTSISWCKSFDYCYDPSATCYKSCKLYDTTITDGTPLLAPLDHINKIDHYEVFEQAPLTLYNQCTHLDYYSGNLDQVAECSTLTIKQCE